MDDRSAQPEGAAMPAGGRVSSVLRRFIGNPDARVAILRMMALVGARVGGTLMTLAYTLLLSRVASQQDFGLAMAAMSVSFLVSVPMSMNVEMGSMRYLAKYIADGADNQAAGFIRFARGVVFAMAAVLALGGAVYYFLQGGGAAGQAGVYAIALTAAPVVAMSRLSARNAVIFDAVLGGTLPRILVRPILFILSIGGAFLMGAQMSAVNIAVLFLVSAVMSNVVQYFMLRRHFRKFLAFKADISEWPQWVKTGVMLSPLLVMNEFMRDVIITSAAVSLAKDQVALLVISISLIGVISFAVTSVDIALTSRIAQALLKSATERSRKLLGMAAGIKCLAVLVVGTAVVLLRDPILALLGEDYVAAGSGLVMLLAMPAATAILGPGDMVLTVLGHRKYVLIASLAGLFGIVSLTVLGGLLGGFQYAAGGAALAFTMQQLILYLFCRTKAGVDPSVFGLLRLLGSRG